MNKMLFVTTANLSTNPRLLKEIRAAIPFYHVKVIAFEIGNWSDDNDRLILNDLKIDITYISATRNPFLPWLFSSLLSKLCRYLYPLFSSSNIIAALASNKRSFLILKALLRLQERYDVVILHNLGTLYPGFVFSKKNKIPFIFDIEDFHPGESVLDGDERNEVKRRKLLMATILPEAAAVTYASPLIGEYTLKLLHKEGKYLHQLVNNSFPANEFHLKETQNLANKPIHFVWFSQNITSGRGVELFIEALSKFQHVKLTLIGQMSAEFEQIVSVVSYSWIEVMNPLTQTGLHEKLGEFDIGLACDLPSADLNRELALTNKIFAYYQAGLFTLATDTLAQQWFMNQHTEAGILVSQNVQDITKKIELTVNKIEEIRSSKRARYEAAKFVAWEKESAKLVSLWKEVI